MSTWDKIYRWQSLGVQGTLLAQFIQPIHFTSVVIGSHHIEDLSVLALNRRTPQEESPAVPGAVATELALYETSGRRTVHRQWGKSLNWIAGDEAIEAIDTDSLSITHVCNDSAPTALGPGGVSRLCRRSLFQLYHVLCAKRHGCSESAGCSPKGTYGQAKRAHDRCWNERCAFITKAEVGLKSPWVDKSEELSQFHLDIPPSPTQIKIKIETEG